MTEEKRARLVAAATVNIILLVVILAALIIYQVAVMAQLQSRRKALVGEIEEYKTQTEQQEDLLGRLQSQKSLQDLLIPFGWYTLE